MTESQPHYRPTVPDDDPKWISVVGSPRRYNRNLILFVLLIALAMSLVQVSSVNVALSSIQQATEASASQLQWVLSGYALAFGVMLVPSGRLGDLFGRGELFVAGLALFTLASTACGFVDDANLLNLFRLIQGVASGMLSPQVTGMIQQYFQGQARAKAFSLFGFVISVSVALGPIMAGSLIQWLGADNGWRWSFIVNLPLGVLGLIAAFRWLPFNAERRRRQAGHSEHRVARRIDLDPVGMVLLVVTILCLMLPFVVHNRPWIWWLLPGAAVLGAAWIRWEHTYARRGRSPMVDLNLFKLQSFSFCVSIAFLQFLGITSVFALVAIYMQQGLGMTAIAAALIGLPNALASAVSSLWSGKYAIIRGRGLQVFAVSMMLIGVIMAGGFAWLVTQGHTVWWMMLGFMVQGIGQGMMASVNQTQAMLDVPPAQGGVAGGVTQTVQRIATAIGNAMLTGIFFMVVGDQATATTADWSAGIATAYLVVGGIMAVAVLVAIVYWRSPRITATSTHT